MNTMHNKFYKKHKATLVLIVACFLFSISNINSQIPDPNQGLRASWMRGAWGALWLPETCYNGKIEGVTIADFITQIKDIRTIDYVQIGLTNPNVYSPVHTAPNSIIESLWHGDVDSSGNPKNLVVPRAAKADPFLSWLKALRAAGLKAEVYVNSYNLLDREPTNIPADFPNLSARWKAYCDTNATVQAYIASNPYIKSTDPVNRKYMFCYAEFILKEYAIRYGDLISAWCFDSADNIMESCGDNAGTGVLADQRLYQAFADACHAGNTNAAIAFNNSVGTDAAPFATPTLFEDYSFGHPFGGAGNMVETTSLYNRNFGICQFMSNNQGLSFKTDYRSWNDNVVGHFFPKQSATSWNSGNTACLTDAQFVEWTSTGITNGGAITWGTPLVRVNLANSPVLTLQPYALTQLSATDTYLKQYQSSGAPNWARQYTILNDATIGIPYSQTLIEGVDLWDPEGDAIISLLAQGSFPSWLTISKTAPGVWTLSGTPTESSATAYEFNLQASDASGGTKRAVELNVIPNTNTNQTTVEVQITPTANTNYGINAIATMYSEVQTAADGFATYRVAIQVTPPTGKAVISGISGGTSTEKSWGLGNGTNSDWDDIFNGIENEWVKSIKNIQIIDFNTNGGTLTASNFSTSFKSITIENAQSTNDNVSLTSGTATANLGKLGLQTQTLNLASVLGVQNCTDFAIGVGNASDTNKWSVGGINVTVVYNSNVLSSDDFYANRKQNLVLFPNPATNYISLNIIPKKVCVFDLNGKKVITDTLGNKEIDIANLIQGMYLIKVENEEGKTFFSKFLKKNQ